MKKAWTWLTSRSKWWLIPSIALALGALWSFFRPERPGTVFGPGISPKAGAEALKIVHTASEDEAQRIKDHSASERREIEGRWGDSLCVVLLLVLAVSGCAAGIQTPDVPAWPDALSAPHMALSEGCEYSDEDHLLVQCPGALFAQSLIEILDMRDRLAHTARRLKELEASASIKQDIALARTRAAEDRTRLARQQRWIFGSVGAAAGVILTIVGVAVVD